MIHIYRATRYPNYDFLLFQPSEESVKRFRCRFPVQLNKANKGFEQGYYTYLRGQSRDTLFKDISTFLRTDYYPPELRLSAFRSTSPLSKLWPAPIWQGKIVDAISSVFRSIGYTVTHDKFSSSVEVMPPRPGFSNDNCQVYYGVAFCVEIPDDLYPILWCCPRFKFLMDGEPINQSKIVEVHGETSKLTRAIRSFTTRSAEGQFKLLRRFVGHIPPLNACEQIAFGQEPVKPAEIGLETWFWLHESEACFEMADGFRTNLAQAALKGGIGLYTQPTDVQVIVLLPSPDDNNLIVPRVDWQQVVDTVRTRLNQMLPSVRVPVEEFYYPLDGDLDPLVQRVADVVATHPGHRSLCLMIIGPEAHHATLAQTIAVENQSHQLNKKLRSILQGGYTTTISWEKLINNQMIPCIIDNALIGSFYRLNAQPWLLSNLPFQTSRAEATYFLGLDGDANTATIATTLFDHRGALLAFGAVRLERQRESPKNSSYGLGGLVETLLQEGVRNSRQQPRHIIVHLTPRMAASLEELKEVFRRLTLTSDIVEVNEASIVRFLQPSNRQGTPSHGIAVGSETTKVAYLMNTHSVGEKTERGFIFPNPGTVAVQRLDGTSPVKDLAAHVYWLSVAHMNALHRTVDTPITIAYTKSLYEHVLKTRKPMRVTKNDKKTLYWL